ncbi:MAG: SH3 domain-containing protein, partial [Lachnospiraceae bacterium]|nr:SH3 domain-containing protein [Lachnospiraceae bacterium]
MNRRKNQLLKGCILSFVFALGVFLWPAQSMQVHAAGSAKVNASTGFIREKADTKSDSVGSVKKGDKLDVIETTTDGDGKTWYKVYVDGTKTGYIRSDLVTVEGSVSEGKENTTKTESTSTTTESGGNKTVVGSNNSTETVKKEETKTETQVAVVNVSESDVATVKANTDVRVRKGAGTNFDVAGVGKTNTEMTVSGVSTDSEGKKWYQVSFNEGNKTVNGFVREDLIEVLTYVEPEVEEEIVEEEIVEEEPVVENMDYHLNYMQNDAGEMEWFLFDNIHGTSQSLEQLLSAIDQMKENELKEAEKAATMRILIIALGAVCAILIVIVTIMIFKLRDASEYEYEDDDEDEYEEDD